MEYSEITEKVIAAAPQNTLRNGLGSSGKVSIKLVYSMNSVRRA